MSNEPQSQFLLYQTRDGQTRLEVRLEYETVWLSLNQLAELFQRDKSVISRHINNVFEGGIDAGGNCCKICNSSSRRWQAGRPRHRVLQPGCHYQNRPDTPGAGTGLEQRRAELALSPQALLDLLREAQATVRACVALAARDHPSISLGA